MIKFTKMEGLGNDYVYINCIEKSEEEINYISKLAKKISDRHFGIGSDGLILICKSDVADFKMKMYNQDGSEAQMCGNGIRFLKENSIPCIADTKVENKFNNDKISHVKLQVLDKNFDFT